MEFRPLSKSRRPCDGGGERIYLSWKIWAATQFRAVCTIGAFLIPYTLQGCFNPDRPLVPSDAQYPKLNRSSRNPLPIHIDADRSFKVSAAAIYVATRDSIECDQRVFLGARVPLAVEAPILSNGDSDTDILIDKFEPGYCKWRFANINLHPRRTSDDNTRYGVQIYYHDLMESNNKSYIVINCGNLIYNESNKTWFYMSVSCNVENTIGHHVDGVNMIIHDTDSIVYDQIHQPIKCGISVKCPAR